MSVVLAGLALALPVSPGGSGDLAAVLHTCAMLLREQYSTPGGAVIGVVGLLVAVTVPIRTAYCLSVSMWSARTGRQQQRSELALVARLNAGLDLLVLDHPACAAYCVPGRGGRVVITSGALATLDEDQLAAVLAHERAHLTGRHDLVIQAAASLRASFPFVPGFRAAVDEVARLTEMLADDASCRTKGRLTLATALSKLAVRPAPVGALGAGGSTAMARIRRLALPAASLGWGTKSLTGVGLVGVLTMPIALAVLPALTIVSASYCPITMA